MKRRIGIALFRILGWKLSGSYPDVPKSVMVIAPHTSMWDFVFGRISFWALGIRGRFLIKGEMFFFPLGMLLRALGGLPVNRASGRQSFSSVIRTIRRSKRIVVIITPEGTRKRVEKWKRGFYTIAMHAEIPLVLGSLDYSEKIAHIGPLIHPSGNYAEDMVRIEQFYRGRKGKHPARFNL